MKNFGKKKMKKCTFYNKILNFSNHEELKGYFLLLYYNNKT